MPKDISKAPYTRYFPFECKNLDEADMEILNATEIWDELSIEDSSMPPNHGVLICSSADDSVGVGNLLVISFDEIITLGRGEDDRCENDDDLYVISKTTEGEEFTLIYDFRVI